MLAEAAGVDVEKMAAGFGDPLHLFEHLTLEDLARISTSAQRFTDVQREIQNALQQISSYAEGYLAAKKGA